MHTHAHDHTHALHPLLVVLGLVGVAVLLVPQVRASRRRPSEARDASRWRAIAVSSSLAAAGVHAVVVPAHLHESLVVGVFFVAVAMAQTAWAYLAHLRATRVLLAAGIAGSLALIVLWSVSRTVGLPFGLGREAVGAWDLAAGAWELVVAAGCVTGLRRPRAERAQPLGDLDGFAWSWVGLCVAALLVLSLSGAHG